MEQKTIAAAIECSDEEFNLLSEELNQIGQVLGVQIKSKVETWHFHRYVVYADIMGTTDSMLTEESFLTIVRNALIKVREKLYPYLSKDIVSIVNVCQFKSCATSN